MEPINILIERFLADKDVLPETKRAYRYSLKSWVTWLTINPTSDVCAPLKKDILLWKSELLSMNYSDLTVQAYLRVVALFYKWQEAEKIGFNIADGICKRKPYRGHRRKYLTMDQVTLLLTSMPRESLIQKRNRAIVGLMLGTGIRCIEACRLKIKDIKPFNNGYSMQIQRKGRSAADQTYCCGVNSFKYVAEYLKERMEEDDNQPLFANHGWHSRTPTMTPQIVGQMIAAEFDRIGLKGREFVAHSLRHSFACLSLLEGATLFDIKVAMGHASIQTTEIYLSSLEEISGRVNPAVMALDIRLSEM